MEILFNKEKKKEIKKLFVKSNSRPKMLHVLSIVSIIVGIIMAITFFIMVLKGGSSISVNTYVKAITLFIYGLVFFVIFKFLEMVSSLKNLLERVEEQLVLKEDAIKYVYKIKFDGGKNERIVIFLPYERITSVSYNETTKQIAFYGTIFVQSFNNYFKDSEPSGEDTLDNFIMYDYFEKSLLDILKEKEIKINLI